MSKPTLALIPSGYKSGKVYSILPNDATGDFDFTRQSIGTRVRKDGLIEEAKTVGSITNLQIRSEEFDNSAWIKSDISVTANDTLAPNGTNTADAIVEGTGTGGKIIYDTYTTSLGVYTFSVHIKKEDKRYTAIQVSGSTTTSMFNVDLDNGTGQVVAGSFDETNIETLANDWYRVSVTFTASSGTLNNQIYLMNGSAYANRNYTGNGTDKNYVWGAMLSEGALSDYIKTEGTTETKTVETFTDVPRLDWLNSNCPSLLLEPQRTNLLKYSENYSQSEWSKIRSTISTNQSIAPNGTFTADKIIASTDNNTHRCDQAITLTDGTIYSLSFFVKASEYNCIRASIGQGGATFGNVASFNLNTKTVSTTGTIENAEILDFGNGWFRCISTMQAGSADRVVIGIGIDDSYSFAGDNSSGLFMWGAMIEQASYSSSYIKTEGEVGGVTRLADVCSVTTPSGVTEIVETFLDDTTNTITTIPSTYTISEGKIKKVIMT